MAEFNIGALTGSKSYTGSVGTTNIDNLYKFTINSPGSFNFAIDDLNGNADIFLLNKAGAIIKSSSNSDKTAETISAEGLLAGEYTIRVLQISGDIKYTLNLAQVSSPKTAGTDTITGAKVETTSPSTIAILPVSSTSEKPAVSRDAVTGSAIEEKAIVAADKIAATDKSVTTLPATTTDKPVTTTSTTTDKPATTISTTASTTIEKPVTTTSTTPEKPATTTSTTSAISTASTTTEKSIATTSTTTEKPATTLPATTTSTTVKPATTTSTTSAVSTTTEKPATTTSTTSAVSTTTEKPATTTSTTTEKPATTIPATTESATTEKPVTTTSTTSAVSTTTEKPVTTTSTTSAVSTTTEKPVTTTSTITEKPAISAVSTTIEKPVANTSTTTEKPATTTSTTTEKPFTTTSTTSAVSTTIEKPVTTISTTSAVSTTTEKSVTTTSTTEKPATSLPATASTTTEKPVTTTSTTTDKPATTLPTTTTAVTTAVTKDPLTGEILATQETKTDTVSTAEKPVIASLDASKAADKPNTATSNAEETKKETTTTALPTTETKKEPEPTTDKKLISPFTSGIFTTDQTGRISVDYTFDGGMFQGELAVFSLEGLEKFEPGSEAFIKEVAARSLSNSVKGHVVINDATEGARFSGLLGESNVNEGVYLGVKSFAVTAGGKYGVMLVPNGSVKSVFDNPTVGGAGRPLFSMAMANPVQGFNFGQIADVTGEGNTFVMEDMRLDAGSDKDYNDIIFQVRGATAKAALLDSVINPDKDWRKTDLGKAVIAYAKPYITPEPKPKVDAELSDLLDDLEKEILKPVTSDKETPRTPSPTPTTGKDADNSNKIVPISIPPSKTGEKAKNSASNAGDLTKVETSDKIDTKPITSPTISKDTAADLTEKLPVEKTPVPPVATEVKDKVTESPATATLPAKSTTETEVAATTPIQKVETKPEVLPTESKVKEESKPVVVTEVKDKVTEVAVTGTSPVKSVAEKEVVATRPILKVETKPEVLPVETKVKEESKTVMVTEVKDTVTEVAVTAILPVKSVEVKDKVTEVAVTETLPVKSATEKEVIAMTPTQKVETKPEILPTESKVKDEILPVVSTNTGNDVNADWIARLESIKQRLSNLGSADVVVENAIDRTLIARLEAMTEKLREQTRSTPVSDNTATLISRLEDMVVQVAPQPVETVQFEFPKVAQPLVGIFNENGFSQDNPKIDYSRITLAKDRVENDANPLVSVGEGNNPDSAALAIFEQINKNAPLVVGRAPASSEEWAKSLIEYVDTAKASGQPNAIASLNLNLTQIKKDGSITPRYELTKAEKDALAYAQKYNVLVVVPAGDDRETMSALGEISLEFDNIMTVGAAKRVNDSVAVSKAYDLANTSGSGYALDILADGSSGETFNTSVAANKVAGAASQVWAANPKLSYRQVVDIIQRTATDLNTPNWDFETGSGLLNIPAAVNLAKVTPAIDTDVPIQWLDVDKKNQPLIGIIDTGFNGKNPDIDYKRIILGRDRVDNDNDPLLGGEGSEHGTHVLGIIGATQGNGIGIDGINDDAPIWLGRAIGSGKWAESLREFVDAAKASGQPKAVVNLSFDLTQTNPDGSVTTRYELTPQERQAIEYARQNGVMIVVAAGNNAGTMSALGQASQEFDNIITVGSINYNGDRADYSSFGYGLDFVARGGTPNEQVLSTIGEGVNLKQMIGDEEPPEDEMSANARTTFEEVFGAFSDGKESENDEKELESLTPEERQVYDEATKEIDQILKDYLGAASEKIALEYVDGYYDASVDALSKFVDAFDEDLADNLIKAQEILEEAGFKTDTPTETNLDFSIPLDLGIGEMAGTSVAAAKVTGAVSQVWAANPGLSYFQVKEILKQTAVDLNKPGWDLETGSGLVNIAAAVELAKRIQPQAYQPKPIQSPLTWSGEGKVTPGERAVAVSVPTFTGRLMNAGYVTQTGWLRIRSGPGTNFAEVGRKYPGDATNFDAYENNGAWVPDPSMPGGGSSRWYKIAGTNNWMSALYIDNTPERADQERQQQDAIRRAEEDARRAEDAIRRAEEDARRAEDELRRLEEEQRRAEEEARRRAEEEARRRIEEELRRILEEQRRRQEQLQAAISQATQKVGDLGKAIGSYVNNGVTVYQTEKGVLLVQPDARFAFYENGIKPVYENVIKPFNEKVWSPLNSGNFLRKELFRIPAANTLLDSFVKSNIIDPKGFWKTLDTIDPAIKFLPPDLVLSNAARTREFFVNGNGVKLIKGLNSVGDILNQPVIKKLASNSPVVGDVIDLGFLATDLTIGDEKTKRRAQLKAGAMGLAGGIGFGVGLLGFGAGSVPLSVGSALAASALMDIAYLGIDWMTGNDGKVLDSAIENSFNAIGNGFNAVSSFTTNALEAAKAKAKAELEKAKVAAAAAKVAYQTATATVQQANAAYQTFTQEVKKQTTQIVQQSQQKLKEAAQKVVNNVVKKVAQNPVVQQVSKVAKQVANYAQKAVKTVGNIINGAKQFVNNVIDTGKQFVNNVIDTGKKAYQEVKNFVANTYETGKKVVTETYNKAAQAVNTVTNTISNGFNAAKSLFRW